MPETIHAPDHGVVWSKEVGSVCEYGEKEANGIPVAEEGSDASPCGGKVLYEREDSLGQGQPVSKVVSGGESGGEAVS